MTIPEAQLDTWSHSGATATSSACYTSVKAALEGPRTRIPVSNCDIFLQGSYRNSTNIYGDSDVDIVARLRTVFQSDLSALDATQKSNQDRAYQDATYTWSNFRADVLQTLQDYYGNAQVTPSDRCIKVDTGHGRIKADVVPAITFKKYKYFYPPLVESVDEGISFYNRAGVRIVNYPKIHIANGEAKNAGAHTNGWYKPTVRLFKNIRNRLINDGVVVDRSCSSYALECLVYNAPDDRFGGTYQDTVVRVFNHLWTRQFDTFICQNGIVPLFGTSPAQWNTDAATKFLVGLRELWNNWR